MNSVELLAAARGYLQKVSTGGNESVPTELIDGLSLYEKHLRKQVTSTPSNLSI
jgi:hypothetical protein